MHAGIIVAVLGTSIAVFCDFKNHRIPNSIPASMLLLSFPLAFMGNGLLPWALNLLLSSILFYVFWMLRVWAAGDSKLLIAVAALVPQYPSSALLTQPAYGGFFFLTVLFNLLIVYLLHTVFLILQKSQDEVSFAFISGSALTLLATAYDRSLAAAAPFLFSFLVYSIYVEATKLDMAQAIPASSLAVGDNLAERISEDGGVVTREREQPASVSSLLRRLSGKEKSSPAPHGLSSEEKERILCLVASGRIEDGIRVYRGTIMSPMILCSLIAAVTLGDVLAAAI